MSPDGLYLIEGEFPVWALVMIFGVLLAAVVFCSTTNEQPPPYHFVSIWYLFLHRLSARFMNCNGHNTTYTFHTYMQGMFFYLFNFFLHPFESSVGFRGFEIELSAKNQDLMSCLELIKTWIGSWYLHKSVGWIWAGVQVVLSRNLWGARADIARLAVHSH